MGRGSSAPVNRGTLLDPRMAKTRSEEQGWLCAQEAFLNFGCCSLSALKNQCIY